MLGRHLPPPAGVQPPSLWGTEGHLQSLFGEGAAALERDLTELLERHNKGGAKSFVAPGEYLEVVITRR